MADYPVRGTSPWDLTLKAYIDEQDDMAQAAAEATAETALAEFGTLATAINQTVVPTSFTTAAVPVEGCSLAVEPTERDVWLQWGGLFGIATAGLGVLLTRVYDVTDGGAVITGSNSVRWESGLATNTNGPSFNGLVRVGPSAAERVYSLYALVIRDSGSSLAANIRNGLGTSGVQKTILTAVAR